MPERAAIDPLEETVRISGRVWRFDWDASTGTLSIALDDGRTYELHGMTWRQKVNLARAVSAGMLPIERGVLRAALGPGATVPADDRQREVLTALAEWLTASNDPLPWDPATLARVTIGVCQQAGFRPRDLDELPAADIEDMWKGLRAESPSVEPVAAAAPPAPPPPPAFRGRGTEGFNRIIIVPDPPAPPPPTSAPARAPSPAPAENVSAGQRDVEPPEPEATAPQEASLSTVATDVVAAIRPSGFVAAPAETSPERTSAAAAPPASRAYRLRVPTAAAPTSAPLPVHASSSASAPAAVPLSPVPAPAASSHASAPLSVRRPSAAARLELQPSPVESGVTGTPLPARYRMESPESAPARPSNFSPTAPAAGPLPPARAIGPASPRPDPPPMLPVEGLEVPRLPAAAGAAMSIVAAAPPAVPQPGAAPFDERDLIPFLTTSDDTRARPDADVTRRFADDLTRAAIEAGVELES